MAPLLRLVGIGKRYGAVEALRGVDLDVDAGEVVAICGDNGAGKSTLIRIVSGAHEPSAGRIEIDGESGKSKPPDFTFSRNKSAIHAINTSKRRLRASRYSASAEAL